jgi:hypothetical protein
MRMHICIYSFWLIIYYFLVVNAETFIKLGILLAKYMSSRGKAIEIMLGGALLGLLVGACLELFGGRDYLMNMVGVSVSSAPVSAASSHEEEFQQWMVDHNYAAEQGTVVALEKYVGARGDVSVQTGEGNRYVVGSNSTGLTLDAYFSEVTSHGTSIGHHTEFKHIIHDGTGQLSWCEHGTHGSSSGSGTNTFYSVAQLYSSQGRALTELAAVGGMHHEQLGIGLAAVVSSL